MLRELIYALNGYHGEVFCFDEKTKMVQVASDLAFIQPSEQAILNKICQLSTFFIKLKSFIDETQKMHSGIYRKAFARALETYLMDYQAKMCVLEKMVVDDEFLGLSSIHTHTQKYQIVFPVLSGIVDNIIDNQLQGCNILDVLYKASNTGIMEVKLVTQRLLQKCSMVFYKHLSLWIFHGLLPQHLHYHHHNHLNIKHNNNNNNNKNNNENNNNNITNNNNNNSNHNNNNNNANNSNYVITEEFIINEVKGKDGIEESRKGVTQNTDQSRVTYEVNVGQLPAFVSLSLAERILFVGQSLVLFKNGRNADEEFKKDHCLISGERKKGFEKVLSGLSRSPVMDVHAFQNSVHLIRNHVAQQLYILIVEKSDLQRQLRRFKDFFLIGRGELFLTFIDQSHNLLTNPPSNTTQYDVNLAFEHSCRDLSISDEHKQQFKLLIKMDESDKNERTHNFLKGRKNGWECLEMSAIVDWPLHVVFTRSITHKYQRLFSFLLLAKRTQLQLQHCWSLQRRNINNKINATKNRLRNHMSFFVDNLQYYLQVDVIDSNFSLLLNKLQSVRDFEEILLAHETFLVTLTTQCFIHSKQIYNCLTNIFDLCQSYYGLVVYCGEEEENFDGGGDNNSGLHDRLKEVEEAFRKQSHLLFEMLSSNARINNHLPLLLLRIDFNRYFSKII